ARRQAGPCMSVALLSTAQFFTTVAQLQQLPATGLPEVAFVGRSNAGKSSAINRLCNRNRLAFASRTPGRTQALNYFSLGLLPPRGPAPAVAGDAPARGGLRRTLGRRQALADQPPLQPQPARLREPHARPDAGAELLQPGGPGSRLRRLPRRHARLRLRGGAG